MGTKIEMNSEKWYRALYEESPSMYFTVDTNGKILSINKFGAEQLGYKVEELVGQSILKVIYEDDKEIILKEIAECLHDPRYINVQELRKVRRDGSIIWVKEITRAIRIEGGSIVVLIVCEEITDRKQVEEELRKSEERFRQIAESADEWIWEVDAGGLYTYSSPVIEKILGYSPEEIVGKKHFYDFFAPDVRDDLKKVAFETFARKETFKRFVNPNVHKNGNIVILETSGLPVLDERGNLSGYRGVDTDITEHKRMDEDIFRREQESRALVENAPDIIARFDKKLRHTYINKVIEQKMGIPRSSFIGKTNRELGVPENIVALWDNALQTVFKTGEEKIIETYFPTPGGNAYFETHLVPEFARDGSVESVLLISRDITERKLSEEALRRAKDELEIRIKERTEELAKANELLQGIINNSTAVIYVKDTLGRHIMVNRQFETLFHIKSEQIKGKTVYDIFPKETADTLRSNDQKVLQARTPLEFDEVVPQDDGLHTYISIKFPLFDQTGNPYAICGISTDITERKRAEQVLLESEQRYRSLFENMLDGFAYCKMLFDDRGNPVDFVYLEVNSAFERLTGLENVAGKKVTEVMPGIKESHPELFEIYGRVALTGKPQKFEIEFKPLGIWLSVSAYSTKREYFVAVFDNITERKRAEEELRRRTEDLARANAEMEQFTYIAAHDLQEPLRMVSIFTQLLANRYRGRLDKDADEFIGYIVEGAKHMQQMIEDLHVYSRIGTRGKPFEPADCEAVFNQAVANLKVAIEENEAKVTHDPLPTVMADASQQVELFQNLISNAIKFRREETPHVHIRAKIRGNDWIFSVRDNGIGISPEFMERLFKIFQREHVAKYPGTGIGLAICRRIVERHGGRIWAESEVGRGSTFYFTIPARRNERQ